MKKRITVPLSSPCSKGDVVALQHTHRPSVALSAPASVSRKPYDTWHLAEVMKANVRGLALRVRLFGEVTVRNIEDDRNIRIFTLAAAEPAARRLGESRDGDLDSNTFRTRDELKAAILAGM